MHSESNAGRLWTGWVMSTLEDCNAGLGEHQLLFLMCCMHASKQTVSVATKQEMTLSKPTKTLSQFCGNSGKRTGQRSTLYTTIRETAQAININRRSDGEALIEFRGRAKKNRMQNEVHTSTLQRPAPTHTQIARANPSCRKFTMAN